MQNTELHPATIIINVRIDDKDITRFSNLQILLKWLEKFFPNKFDILIIEQDIKPHLDTSTLTGSFRHEFIYNPKLFNRGWGFNVAVKSFCPNSKVVVFFDTDILPATNLLSCVEKCLDQYDVASPYKNIYYSDENERDLISKTLDINFPKDPARLSNPVTITGGILAIKKDVFESVYGFEQYIGYGGEDRALDVTLLNTVSPEKIYISDETYIHLYHPREDIDKSQTANIMQHLHDAYGCKWHRDITATEYIHKLCCHKNRQEIEFAIDAKKISYGDIALYKNDNTLTINGISKKSFQFREFLHESRVFAGKHNFNLSLKLLNYILSGEIKFPKIFNAIVYERKRSIANQKKAALIYDFVFIPHKKYHTHEFVDTVNELIARGFSAVIVDPSPPHPDEGAFVESYRNHFISYDFFIKSECITKCIVCANDWERPVVQPLIKLANFHNIPTVALVEGVNDFHDVDVRIPGSAAHYRNVYGSARYIALNGNHDRKYFTSPNHRLFVTGITRLRHLEKFSLKRKSNQPNGKFVLINLNFSYGVKSNDAEIWLENAVKACQNNNLEFLISKHPQDQTPTKSYPISKRGIYEDLSDSSAFITRFSGSVFEALVIGTPVIYFNPSIEKIDKFINPMGAYDYANSFEELLRALETIKTPSNKDVADFLNEHVGGNPAENYVPHLKFADALVSIHENHVVSNVSSSRFIKSAMEFYEKKESFVIHGPDKIDESALDSAYSIDSNISFCKCLNQDLENLHNKIVKLNGRLYLLKSESKIEFFLIPSTIWNSQFRTLDEIVIHEIDFDSSAVNATGLVYDLQSVKKTLQPGLTFLIRAKNEYKNVFFVLGSLRALLRNKRFNCEVVFVDNNSDDNTYNEVIRTCRTQEIQNVFLYKYPVDVSKSGDEHSELPVKRQMHRSLDTYYNWCLSKANKYNIIKWDADFLAINDNLIEMIETYNLDTTKEKLAIWCSGKTLYKYKDTTYVNLDTEYNEFRVFSKLNGYKWDYAPRWEISSQEYLSSSNNFIFTKSVFLELKDCEINEFANRSNASHISSCPRDTRDSKIINLLQNNCLNVNALAELGLSDKNFLKIDFNPLSPSNYDTVTFNNYVATFKELTSAQSYWINIYSRPSDPIRFRYPDNIIVQGLWVGKRITDIHRMCLQSFLKAGHCFILYTYEKVDNVPDGVVLMNAEDYVPSSLIYSYSSSFAGFSDLFRSKLMEAQGGWYVDLDIFCLKRLDFQDKMVFSLDHYSAGGPVVHAKDGLQIFPVRNNYYCATNPLKLDPKTPVTRWMYIKVLNKILSSKILNELYNNNSDVSISKKELVDYLEKLKILNDFNDYICDISDFPEKVPFTILLSFFGISEDEIGQKTWNEIGPKLVTEAALRFGNDHNLFEPIWFQGSIPYFEVEKYISPDYDFMESIQNEHAHTLDFFFTMWKNRGLLDKKDEHDNTLYKHLERLVTV